MRLPSLLAASCAALALDACSNAQPCPSPLEVCNGNCVDLGSDSAHCGMCGRFCGGGRVCRAATCVESTSGACANRSGGAFVVLGKCGQSVKLWTTSATFVARAEALVADPAAPGASVPVLDLLPGTDCDAQWTWHGDPEIIRFDTAMPPADCDACPRAVEDEKAYRVTTVGVWCPLGARVLAVDPRP
jgi:hypothetical protein